MAEDQQQKPEAQEEIFSAEEMQRRGERLKAEGRVPPLADVLKAIQKATQK